MVTKGKFLLMSIRPVYTDRILAGEKRCELRRRRINARPGDIVIMYASAPRKAIVGAFRVGEVIARCHKTLWKERRKEMGISEEDYVSYFSGASVAYAMRITASISIGPVTLSQIRAHARGFRPPQSYMHWPETLNQVFLLPALKRLNALANQACRYSGSVSRRKCASVKTKNVHRAHSLAY